MPQRSQKKKKKAGLFSDRVARLAAISLELLVAISSQPVSEPNHRGKESQEMGVGRGRSAYPVCCKPRADHQYAPKDAPERECRNGGEHKHLAGQEWDSPPHRAHCRALGHT